MPTCIVESCRRTQAGHLEAGLDLQLCGNHLTALRRMCKGKNQLAYARLAVREIARLRAAGRTRSGRVPVTYACKLCGAWHVGHQGGGRADVEVDQDARDAAAAVRALLTPGQLYDLTTSWRHGRATRPDESPQGLDNPHHSGCVTTGASRTVRPPNA